MPQLWVSHWPLGIPLHCLIAPLRNYSYFIYLGQGFPGGAGSKEPACWCRRHKRWGFNPWVGKISWRRQWKSTPVFLAGEFHGQKSLAAVWSIGWQRVGHNWSNLACTYMSGIIDEKLRQTTFALLELKALWGWHINSYTSVMKIGMVRHSGLCKCRGGHKYSLKYVLDGEKRLVRAEIQRWVSSPWEEPGRGCSIPGIEAMGTKTRGEREDGSCRKLKVWPETECELHGKG